LATPTDLSAAVASLLSVIAEVGAVADAPAVIAAFRAAMAESMTAVDLIAFVNSIFPDPKYIVVARTRGYVIKAMLRNYTITGKYTS